MNWQQISLRLAAVDVPRIEALLLVAGAESITTADAGDVPLLEPAPGQTPIWPEVTLKALFPGGLDLGRVVAILPDAETAVEAILDEDWIDAWRREIDPCAIGGRLLLTAADAPRPGNGLVQLRLNMGLAFGTGKHPTTNLCLDWLAAHSVEAARVLDFGCGSGVLGLAALRLGADFVWALDIDPQALDATRDNAELNRLAERIWVGRPEEWPRFEVDIVLANILADPLEQLAAALAHPLKDRGTIVLSGLLEEQLESVRAAYAPYFGEFESRVDAGWARIVGKRVRR